MALTPAGALSPFGTSRVEHVVAVSPTTAAPSSVLRFPGMIVSFSLLVSVVSDCSWTFLFFVFVPYYKVADSNRLICCKSYNCYWLVTLHHYTGDFSDPEVALWSSRNFQMLSSVRVSGPVHDAAFSPSAASQMACVGTDGVYFCFLHTQGQDADLKVNDHKKSINTHNKIFLPDQEFWAT